MVSQIFLMFFFWHCQFHFHYPSLYLYSHHLRLRFILLSLSARLNCNLHLWVHKSLGRSFPFWCYCWCCYHLLWRLCGFWFRLVHIESGIASCSIVRGWVMSLVPVDFIDTFVVQDLLCCRKVLMNESFVFDCACAALYWLCISCVVCALCATLLCSTTIWIC